MDVSAMLQIVSIFVTNWRYMGRRRTIIAAVVGQGLCGFIALPLLKYSELFISKLYTFGLPMT